MKHKKYLIFIIAVWAFLVFPFAGMLFWRSDETTENTELASFPSLKTEEGWNQEYLSEMGAYFDDHFALQAVLGYGKRSAAKECNPKQCNRSGGSGKK